MVIAKVKMEDFILKGLKKQLLLFWTIIIASLGYFLSIKIYLFPIMGWNILLFALYLPLSFGYCYLIWYSTDTPELYKEPIIIIFEPRLYDYKNHECENDFSEDIKQYLLYKEKLENIKDCFERYSNRDVLIFAILPLFVGVPMATLFIKSLLHIKVPILLAMTVSLLVVTACLGLFLYTTRRIYYPRYALQSFEYSETDMKTPYAESRTTDSLFYNRQKIYAHNSYLNHVENPLKRRHKTFLFCALTPIVVVILGVIFLK